MFLLLHRKRDHISFPPLRRSTGGAEGGSTEEGRSRTPEDTPGDPQGDSDTLIVRDDAASEEAEAAVAVDAAADCCRKDFRSSADFADSLWCVRSRLRRPG